MLVRCIDCKQFSLKGDPAAAASGMGICALEQIKSVRWKAMTQKHCDGFEQAEQDAVQARHMWLRRKGIEEDRGAT